MQKAKVTRRAKALNEFILKPNRLRMFIIYTLLFILAYGLGLLIRYAINPTEFNLERLKEDWLIDILIVFGGPILLALLDSQRWIVQIKGGDQLEGLSGAFGERATFAVKDIDWVRTRKSLSSRLKIGNGIYSQTRKRILISPWFYTPDAYQEFLKIIGFNR